MAKRGHDEGDDGYNHKRHRDSCDDNAPPMHFVFQGEIASVQKYGVFVKIPGYKKQGLVHKSQMSTARVEDPSEMVSVREKVYCKVISIEGEHQKIGLSMKFVNQTSGQDMDPNHVELSLENRKKKQGFRSDRPKIELGAIYDTTCARCGTKGHLSKDCYAERGGKQYDLIPELDEYVPVPSPPPADKTKKKKEKKHKKEKRKKKKKRHSHHSSSDSDTERRRDRSPKKKKKRHRHSSSSSSER